MLTDLRLAETDWWSRFRRFEFERRLALLLAIVAVISAIATYVLLTSSPPYGDSVRWVIFLLNADLILLLLLGIIVGRRLFQLVMRRRKGLAGSRLHFKLVALFSVVAVAPAIVVSVFSVFFLSSGLETWFSDQVRKAIENSQAVAEAYLDEHKEVIRADALAMAADLNRQSGLLVEDPVSFEQLVNAQAALRALSEAIVFDGGLNVLARSGLSFSFEMSQVSGELIDQVRGGQVVTITGDTEDRVRALVRLDTYVDAYLFVGRFVDSSVLNYMHQTRAITSQYSRMQSERWTIQITSALLFGIVALLLLLVSFWVGIYFADTLAAPISQLIQASDRVRAGDLMARVPETDDHSEIALLSRSFNRMTSQLSSQRRKLVEANQQIDERRVFTEAVLAAVSTGVVGLNEEKMVVLPNQAASDLLGVGKASMIGQSIFVLIPEVEPIFEKLEKQRIQYTEEQIDIDRGDDKAIFLVRVAEQGHGWENQGYVLTFDEITALIVAQRHAAWSEVARRIAHEIKNPLTPIRLSAERLKRRFVRQIESKDQETFTSATQTIIRQVDTIGRLISEFSNFARMPEPIMADEELEPLVISAINLQKTAFPSIDFQFTQLQNQHTLLNCDASKVTQALNNLLINAVQAMKEHDAGHSEQLIEVRIMRRADDLAIEVQDSGPGFKGVDAARMLEPYVTTKAKGTGLGLAIVRKIMEEHQGTVELEEARKQGAIARLVFPKQRIKNGEQGSGASPQLNSAAS